jgi:hypothetical protein
MADNGSGVGLGLIAGILLVVVVGVAILFATGGLNLGDKKDVNINVEVPKSPELPKVPPAGQ